jgi:hypothetical protein
MPNNNGKEPKNNSLRAGLSPTDPNPRRRYILFSALAASTVAIIVAARWPVTTLETPRWEVWVVDESGQPLEGMTVAMTYQNYSAESEGHIEELHTHTAGHVVFPARTIRVSPLNRVIAIARAAQAGVHASFGPHASVFAFGRGREGSAVDGRYVVVWTGKPDELKSRIVAKPRG